MAKPLLLLMLMALPVLAAEPSPEAIKKAETTYRDVFGAEHDKTTTSKKPADKSAFAKKLLERSRENTNDAVLADVIQRHAMEFAQNDAVGSAVLIEIHKARLAKAEVKFTELEKLAEVYDKSLSFEPITNRAKVAQEALRYYRDAATARCEAGDAVAAMANITKAKTMAKKWTPLVKETTALLEADEKKYAPLLAEAADLEKLKTAIEKNPTDQKLKLQLGAVYAASKRWKEAADTLAGLRQDMLDDAVKGMRTSPLPTLPLANALAKVVELVPMDEKRTRLAFAIAAKHRYDDYRKQPDATDVTEDYIKTLDVILGLEQPGNLKKYADDTVDVYSERAEKRLLENKFTDALADVTKARTALRQLPPTEQKFYQQDLDDFEKAVRYKVAIEAEVAKTEADLKKGTKLSAAETLRYSVSLLRLGRTTDAAKPLAQCSNAAANELAKVLDDPKMAGGIGDKLRTLAADLKAEEKTEVLLLARTDYEKQLETLEASNPLRSKYALLMKDLPKPPYLNKGAAAKTLSVFSAAEEWVTLMNKGYGNVKPVSSNAAAQITITDAYVQGNHSTLKATITENPTGQHDYRYMGCWIRNTAGASTNINLFLADGKQASFTQRDNTNDKLCLIKTGSYDWTLVVRDLHADGVKGELSFFGFGSQGPVKGPFVIDQLLLGKTEQSVRKLLVRNKPN
jgi:hypothetical protein